MRCARGSRRLGGPLLRPSRRPRSVWTSRCTRWLASPAGGAPGGRQRSAAGQRPAHPDRRVHRDAAPDGAGRRGRRAAVRAPAADARVRWRRDAGAARRRTPPGLRPRRPRPRRDGAWATVCGCSSPPRAGAPGLPLRPGAERRRARRIAADEHPSGTHRTSVRRRAQHAGGASQRAAVFLRVLHDALFAGRGSADLLLPRVDLARSGRTPPSPGSPAAAREMAWGGA